jgi:hypothetical protein
LELWLRAGVSAHRVRGRGRAMARAPALAPAIFLQSSMMSDSDGSRKVTLCPASCRREPQFMSQSWAPPRMVRSLDAHDYSMTAHATATRDA